MTISVEELNAMVRSAPFLQHYGFHVTAAGKGTCTVHFACDKSWLRPDGIVSGPVFMAAADVAMWAAIITELGRTAAAAVTVEMKTNFVSAAKNEDLWCTATVRKIGGRVIFGTAECVARDGRLLAHHSLTYLRPAAKSNE